MSETPISSTSGGGDDSYHDGGAEPTQNLSVCILIMTVSGFLRVVATMVLAFPDYLEKKRAAHARSIAAERGEVGEPISKKDQCHATLLVLGHVIILALAAVASIVGTFFGPVSIAVPVQTGAQLLFNVIAMGLILQMRIFNKAQRTGTYVVFFSVLSLIDVGPDIQNNQDIIALLSQPTAWVWSLCITFAMILSAVCTVPLLLLEHDESAPSIFHKLSFVNLTIGVTMSNVGMATAGKTLGILSGGAFGVGLTYYLISSLLGLLFSIVSATACDQGIFTPLSSVALIVVNAFTGIIIWEDWKVIDTWMGYFCACMLMCCGVYLLAEVDILERFIKEKGAEIVGLPHAKDDGDAADLLQRDMSNGQESEDENAMYTETTKLISAGQEGANYA